MSTRRWWLMLALAACGKRQPSRQIFPPTVAGVWRRTEDREIPLGEAPDPVPRSQVVRLETAVYQGPGRLEVRSYELSTPAAGPELAQRWHPSADTVFFWSGNYFVVVKWQQAERKALQQFTREMEKRLKG